MSITVKTHGPMATIILSGGIDYSTQEDFREANHKAITTKGIREIQVDLSEVTFMDSSAIRSMLVLQKQAEAKGIPVILLNCGPAVREIFAIGGFDRMFTIR
jgi:anti-anti-sigma factor